jgi:hypothetical protein
MRGQSFIWVLAALCLLGSSCLQDSHRIRADVDAVSTNAILGIWDCDKAVWCAVSQMTNSVDRLVQNHLTQSEQRQKYYLGGLAALVAILWTFEKQLKRNGLKLFRWSTRRSK